MRFPQQCMAMLRFLISVLSVGGKYKLTVNNNLLNHRPVLERGTTRSVQNKSDGNNTVLGDICQIAVT